MRKLTGWQYWFIYAYVVIMGSFHLYTALQGTLEAYLQRMTHLTFVLPLVFLLMPFRKDPDSPETSIPLQDWGLAVLAAVPGLYAIANYDAIASRIVHFDPVSTVQLVLGLMLVILLLEATRRSVGWPLALIATIFGAYMLVGDQMPGLLRGIGFSWHEIAEVLYLTDEGVFGIPLGVSATFVMIFLIMGGFLDKSGVGEFFLEMAQALTGRTRGGPAKIAVASSGLFGMLSGSAVANVYSTGALTIPMMKRIGYESHFAASVEAVASSGGQIMPPIMGASAFIIASFIGIPYREVMIAAFVPAALFYLAVGLMVHLRAVKLGLRGLTKEELPSKLRMLKHVYMLAPVVILVYMLLVGYTPMRAAVFAIGISWACSLFSRENRMGIKAILDAIYQGSINIIVVAMACAAAGIIIGSINLTGFGFKFVSAVIALSQGIPFVGLALIMVIAIILGMGLPTTGAYLLASAMGVPALIELGFPMLGSHLFVFYFAIVSAITPPVALAAYAASSISGSDPNKTGFTAMRLGVVAYIIPFAFIYDQTLLLHGGYLANSLAALCAIVGATGLAAGMEGYSFRRLKSWERAVLLAFSVASIWPLATVKIGGALAIGAAYLFLRTTAGGPPEAPQPS
ncbi:MAG: TRAP transporter permease [Synergistales bacterium]|nr:TRAP transporter permease [Synergistales bacterium]